MDYSLSRSTVHRILQARILEWIAIPFSRGIFLTQGSNPCLLNLLYWQVNSLPLCCTGCFRCFCSLKIVFSLSHFSVESCFFFL